MNLNKKSIEKKAEWDKVSINLPEFDCSKMCIKTIENPKWVHFGSGNIFRGFIAALQQKLLNSKKLIPGLLRWKLMIMKL